MYVICPILGKVLVIILMFQFVKTDGMVAWTFPVVQSTREKVF